MTIPIRAFVGPNGGGKTLAMVEQVIVPGWRRGLPCVSNLALRPEALGFPPELAVPLRSWVDIGELSQVVLAFDEITSVLPSRQSSSVPPQLARILNQLRKVDVQLAWTAPNWARADVLLREVTQAVTVCHGSWADRWERGYDPEWTWRRPSGPVTRHPEGHPRAGRRVPWSQGWAPNRRFHWTTYSATDFDEFTLSAVKTIKGSRQVYWRPAHRTCLAYDTLQAVHLLDHLDDVGLCVACGGTRRRRSCSCPDQREPQRREPRPARAPIKAPA